MITLQKHQISAHINNRYANIAYMFHFENRNNNSNELRFHITISPNSFISKFEANIDNELFVGQTKEKETASKEYTKAKQQNKNAVLISQPHKKIPNLFEIKTNIDAKSNILLTISIEQYLQKKFGFNQLDIQILKNFAKYNITQKFDHISFKVNIQNNSGIYDVNVPMINNYEIIIDKQTTDKTEQKYEIVGKILTKSSVNELILKYKIKGEQHDSCVLFDEKTETFCHIISDIITNSMIKDTFDTDITDINKGFEYNIQSNILIPRRVVIVIDRSGSMSGTKWIKTISATITALNQLRHGIDRYCIILCGNQLILYPSKQIIETNELNVNKCIKYLESQMATGCELINDALLRGIQLIKDDIILLNQNENVYNFYQNQLILITDGNPTIGETNTDKIILNVKNANDLNNIDKYSLKISLHSFGIGRDENDSEWCHDLNHSFLKLLSINNNGIYKRIKKSQTDTLLNEYFNILSKPILSNIKVEYENKNITHLTSTKFNTLYHGNDLIICGKIKKNTNLSLKISAITGTEIKENNKLIIKPINISKQMKIDINGCENICNTERIWAYIKLQQFATQKLIYDDMIEMDNDEKKENDSFPLSLALKYNFVTPWSSMIVVKHKAKANPNAQFISQHKTAKIQKPLAGAAPKLHHPHINPHVPYLPTGPHGPPLHAHGPPLHASYPPLFQTRIPPPHCSPHMNGFHPGPAPQSHGHPPAGPPNHIPPHPLYGHVATGPHRYGSNDTQSKNASNKDKNGIHKTTNEEFANKAKEIEHKLEDPNCFPKRFEVQVQARIRVGMDLSSQHLTDLPEGSVVTVEEIINKRARISRPLYGWLSVVSKFGARIILPTNSKYWKIGGKVVFKRPIQGQQLLSNGQYPNQAKIVDYNEENSLYKVNYKDGNTQWIDLDNTNVQFISQHKPVKVQKPLDGVAQTFTDPTSQAFFNQFFCKDYPRYQAKSSSTHHMNISLVAIPNNQSRLPRFNIPPLDAYGYPPHRGPPNRIPNLAYRHGHVATGRDRDPSNDSESKNVSNKDKDSIHKTTNEEFVNKVKEIESRIIQHLHQRGYDESHPDYHRYLQKAKELAIQKAGKEREKMLAQETINQRKSVTRQEYQQYMKYKQTKQRQHTIAQQDTSKSSGNVKCLIILRGLPGSGKTTLAKQLMKRSDNGYICTEDKYHWSGKEVGIGKYKFEPQLVFLAREWCSKEIRECIENKVDLIILDNHNAKISMYEQHIQYAVKCGYRFRIIEFIGNVELIDKYRERSHKKFPREVYVKLLKLWEFDERGELINPVFGDSNNANVD